MSSSPLSPPSCSTPRSHSQATNPRPTIAAREAARGAEDPAAALSVVCASLALSVESAAALSPLLLPEPVDEESSDESSLDELVEVALVLETVVEPDLVALELALESVVDALRAEVAAAALYEVVEKEQERRMSYASGYVSFWFLVMGVMGEDVPLW